jgi:hypothetical protein
LDDALHFLQVKLLEFFLRFPPALDGCPALPAADAGAALAAFLISRVLASGQLSDERCGLNLYVLQSSDDMQTKTAWLTITIEHDAMFTFSSPSSSAELAYEKLEITPHGRSVIDPAPSGSNPHGSCSSSLFLNTHKRFSYNTLTL